MQEDPGPPGVVCSLSKQLPIIAIMVGRKAIKSMRRGKASIQIDKRANIDRETKQETYRNRVKE